MDTCGNIQSVTFFDVPNDQGDVLRCEGINSLLANDVKAIVSKPGPNAMGVVLCPCPSLVLPPLFRYGFKSILICMLLLAFEGLLFKRGVDALF